MGGSRPRASARAARSSGCAAGTGGSTPTRSPARIYQAFLLRLAREVARAAIGDRDLCERWLDRADNGFTPHVTSPWRWHSHLMKLWEEGDEELIGRSWDGLVLEALSGALDDLSERFGPDPEAWRWGDVHEMEFPHPLGEANPLLRKLLNRRLKAGGAQETISQIAYDPNDPYKAVWAPSWRMVAEPTAPGALALADVHRPVGPPRQPPLRRPAGRLARGPHPADGRRGPLARAGPGSRKRFLDPAR